MDHTPWVGVPLSVVAICLHEPLLSQLKRLTAPGAVAHLEAESQQYAADKESPLPFEYLDLCVIDFDQDWARASLTAARIREAFRLSSIVAVSSHNGADSIVKAMQCGCDQYLAKPVDAGSLLEVLVPTWLRKRKALELPRPTGQVLAFVGAKGGCGVTTFSTHLGTLLARVHKRKTLLVDSHPQLGDASFWLALAGPFYHLRQLAERADELDSGLLQGFLVRHRSGLDVLPAPDRFDTILRVSSRALERTLEFLRSQYEFVLIDCPPGLNESNLAIIDRADQVYLIAIPEQPCLERVTHYLDYFDRHRRLADVTDRIRLVLNCHEGAISDKAIKEGIQRRVCWTVPRRSEEVLKAINSGDPSSCSADSALMRSLRRWAEEVANKPARPNEQASLASALEPV